VTVFGQGGRGKVNRVTSQLQISQMRNGGISQVACTAIVIRYTLDMVRMLLFTSHINKKKNPDVGRHRG